MIFQWDRKNRRHVAKHGVTPEEAEYVVVNATPPYPERLSQGKFMVHGPTSSGRLLQVIFVYKLPTEVDYYSLTLEQLVELSGATNELIVRIIHAMDLSQKLLRWYRRGRRPK